MKPAIYSCLFLISLFVSCSKNEAPATNEPVIGLWVVHYYWDEQDETDVFSGYVFEFHESGQVKVTKDATTVNGTWQETSNKFILHFENDPVLEELNDDWQKVSRTSNLIHLKEDNPDQDDELHFVRM